MNKLKKKQPIYKNIYSRSVPVTFDKESRTVSGILTTENPVVVADWFNWRLVREVIFIDGVEIPDKIPLLDSHSRFELSSLKGSVVNARIEDHLQLGKVWVADYVLSSTAQREMTLIEEGHLTDTSIGYQVYPEATIELKYGESRDINGRKFSNLYEDKLPFVVRTKVKIIENSLVTIGANEDAKIRAMLQSQDIDDPDLLNPPADNPDNSTITDDKTTVNQSKQTIKIKGDKNMVDVNLEQKRVDAINKLTETFAGKIEGVDLKDTAQLFIQGGKSEREFADFIFERQKQTATFGGPKVDLTEKQLKDFDIFRGLRALYNNQNSLEREISDEYVKKTGMSVKGLAVPYDVAVPKYFKRALTASGAGSGKELVGLDHLGDQFIDYLYSKLAIDNITLLPNRKNNVEIPVLTGSSGMGWAATETATRTEGSPTTSVKTASPKSGGAFVTISKQLLVQSDPPAERIFTNDLVKSISVGLLNAVLNGSGASGQPTGLKNTAGLPTTINFAAAAGGITWAKLVQFESSVDDNFGDDKSMYYVTRRAHRGTLKSTPKESGQAVYICGDDNKVNGYEMRTTNVVTSGDVFFGDWSQIIVPMWDVLDLVFDPYTLATSTQVRIIANQMIDVIVRYPQAFAYGNNFGA